MSEIKGYKLANGHEMIAREVDVTKDHYVLEDAFFLHPRQMEDGTVSIDYAPLTILGAPTGKNHMGFDVELPRISVLFSYVLNPGIVERYLSYTSPLDLSMAPSVR